VPVDIYERDNIVGGLAKTIDVLDDRVEMGPHFFSAELYPELKGIIDKLLQGDIFIYDRLTRIYLNDGASLKYPPQIADIIKNMSFPEMVKAGFSYAASIMKKSDDADFESYMQHTIGRFLYEKYFMEYSKKLWSCEGAALSSGFAKSMIGIGTLNFATIFRKLFFSNTSDRLTKYIYPKKGFSELWGKYAEMISGYGGNIFLNARIKKFSADGKKINGIVLENETIKNYDLILSTIPDAAILNLTGGYPGSIRDKFKQIHFRNVIFVYMQLEELLKMADQNIYVYDGNIRAVRLTNFNNFRQKTGKETLMIEYWTEDQEPLWQCSDEEIIEIAKGDMSRIFPSAKLLYKGFAVKKIPKAYQAPDVNLENVKNTIAAYLDGYAGLVRFGRSSQVNFNYGMEDALNEGIKVAKKIMAMHRVGYIAE
jgi:protoporphyrinogen oxidase